MNKVFRVIWSEAQGAWVAVSETTKSHSKRSRKHALALALTAGSLIGLSGQALAEGKFVPAGEGSIAINSGTCGTTTEAKGEHSVSIGCGAGVNATGPNGFGLADNDTSIGYQAGINVAGSNNSAIGTNAGETVKGNNNTAFGVSAGKTITGNKNTSLGDNSGFSIKGDGNLSVGSEAGGNVTGDHNVMLGKKATVKGSTAAAPISDAVVVGYKASASKSNNVALGFEAKADHENSVALGSLSETRAAKSETKGEISYVTGTSTKTYTYSGFYGTASGVVSVGSAGAERQIINVAPGAITETSTDAINGSQLYGVAAGLNKRIDGIDTSGGGWNVVTSNTSPDESKVAPGAKVDFVSSDKNVAIKHTPAAGGNTSIDFALSNDLTLGVDGKDGADGKIAVNGKDGVSGVTIDGKDGSIGLTGPAGANGKSPTLTMRPDIKLGDVINNTNSITRITYKDADGNDATLATLENDGLRFSGNDNPVAGYVTRNLNQEMQIKGGATIAGSYSSANIKTVATQDGGIEIQIADSPKFGDITINNAGKISGVEAGVDGKDAVNVDQLKDYVGKNNGSWNISDGTTSSEVKTGNTVTIAGNNTGTTAGNINVTNDGKGNLTIESNADVKHDNVMVGGTTIDKDTGITVGDTKINNQGDITVGDKVSVKNDGVTVGDVSITVDDGIHAGGKKITGVADGTIAAGSKDAVNGGQIHDMQVEINKQAGGWKLTDGQGGEQQVKAGDTVAIVGGDNINVEFDAGKMVVETTPDVKHDSVTTGDTLMNDNGVTIKDGPSITKNGVDAGDKKITSVAKGDINKDSTDAINGSQLNETNDRVTVNEGNIKNIQEGKDGMFQVSHDYNALAPKPTGEKSAAGGAGAVASGNNSTAIGNDAKATASNSTAVGNDAQATVSNSTALGNSALASANNSVALGQGSVADRANSVSVGSAGAERQITNVAAGVAPTDAVNVSQLEALGGTVNQYFNAANKRIDKVDNNARAGIAAAMAAGTLPQSTLPGKSMVTVGASTYRGESAIALGVSRLSDNARTVIKANASADSRGNAGAAVGAGWHW